MEKLSRIKILLIVVCCFAGLNAFAQVDEPKTSSDTLYIYDEEITYDTLYLQSHQYDELLTKEEWLEAFQKRGIGQIYYNKGHYWLTGNDEVYKLDNSDLQMLFSPAQYERYRKAKTGQYISIPLYVLGGGAAAIAGIGIVQFGMSFVQFAKAGSQFNDNLALKLWENATRGLFFLGGGMLVATGCLVPAVILTIKGKVQLNRIANEFNTPSTSLRLSFGPTPTGVGVSLTF